MALRNYRRCNMAGVTPESRDEAFYLVGVLAELFDFALAIGDHAADYLDRRRCGSYAVHRQYLPLGAGHAPGRVIPARGLVLCHH